ncbi:MULTISPECIES: NACHT domain-containing protein [unclassified Clostridium]|uniref:NACHT domain-containing protein n=1 Tax=unclassified Clostridium TaxID=2614128 RepID=UPI0013FA967E|nr:MULTISPECIES: NACHT domain-containing protein [unclassified Clostridium]MBN1038263.1 NACHT domain-containing protein [Clostridium botulinum]NFR86166.1 NACHT domain-containing protein [Clostridium botulinum]NFR88916.1 NACHT domain-containing protein [Clostridium botulinum]NFT98737.1 NACHT domain-containing protein [Clostridium botulinum]
MNNEEKKNVERAVAQIECFFSSSINANDKDYGTGFFLDKDVVITASHVIEKYYENKGECIINVCPIKARIDRQIKVKDVITSQNNTVAIMTLEEPVEIDCPLRFTLGYNINRNDKYYTFGYPIFIRGGYPIDNHVSTYINEFQSRIYDWILSIKGERAENFDGFSGAPIFIDNLLVGILQIESQANGKGIAIGMSSVNMIKDYIPSQYCIDYFDSSNLDLIRYRDWVKKVNSSFNILGLDKALSIENSWIELKILSQHDKIKNIKNLKEYLKVYDEWSRPNTDRESGVYTIDDIINSNSRTVVIGGPGSGKSTLCKKIAFSLADKNNILLVKLPRVLTLMNNGKNFDEAILEIALEGFDDKSKTINKLEKIDLLIADGLDECDNKKDLISNSIKKWSLSRHNTKVLITTRPVGYEPSYFNEWTHVELLPLDISDIENSSGIILKDIYKEEYTDKLELFKEQLKTNKVASMAGKSPLLFGFILQLSCNNVILENTRSGLYRQIVESWIKIQNRNVIHIPESILLRSLEIIGWVLQKAAYDERLRSKQNLQKELGKLLQCELGEPMLKAESTGESCIEFWERQGIIECIKFGDHESYIFNHLSICEYISGCYLSKIDNTKFVKFIEDNYSNPYWKEIILFSSTEDKVLIIVKALLEDKSEFKDVNFKKIVLAAECLIEYGDKCEKSDDLFNMLLENLKSPIPKITFKSVELMIKLKYELDENMFSKITNLINSSQEWTYISALRLYLEFNDIELNKEFLKDFIMNYPVYVYSLKFKNLSLCKHSHIEDDIFKLCLDKFNKYDLTPEIKNKLSDYINKGNINEELFCYLKERLSQIYNKPIQSEFEKDFKDKFNFFKFNDYQNKCDIKFLNVLKDIISMKTNNKNFNKHIQNYSSLSKIISTLDLGKVDMGRYLDFVGIISCDNSQFIKIFDIIIDYYKIDLNELKSEIIEVLNEITNNKKSIFIVPQYAGKFNYEFVAKKNHGFSEIINGLTCESFIIYNFCFKILKDANLTDSEIGFLKEKFTYENKKESIINLAYILIFNLKEDSILLIMEKLEAGYGSLFAFLPYFVSEVPCDRIYSVLRKGLADRNLEVIMQVVDSLSEYDVIFLQEIRNSIYDAYIYWTECKYICSKCNIETNGDYCSKCYIVHDCPRAELINILYKLNMLDVNEMISLTNDIRDDVRKSAIDSLKKYFNNHFEEVPNYISKMSIPAKILNYILELEMNKLKEIKEELIILSESDNSDIRYIIIESLSGAKWISDEEAISILNKYILDENVKIRSVAFESLEKRRLLMQQLY